MENVLVSFLLDRSGSMQTVKSDVIGGFNAFLKEQRAAEGKCRFVLTLFDTQEIDTEDFADVRDVDELTESSYVPRSGTPLLDAIGETVRRIDNLGDVGRVLFVIYTDGQENSSHEFNRAAVKALIEERQSRDWDFIFLGAGIDAYAEAGALGIPQAQSFSTDSSRSEAVLTAASVSAAAYRQGDKDYTHALDEERV